MASLFLQVSDFAGVLKLSNQSCKEIFQMKSKRFFLGLLLIMLGLSNSVFAANGVSLAEQAISDNKGESAFAVRELRELGTVGLNTLFETYTADIENFKRTGEQSERWQRIAKALDTVAMQKDVYASKLFWHKDLTKAQAEATRTNKPILSLRLLGNLNEEFSCANSRFFRAILYPNAEISKFLQENYVLHWQSVRPAPKVTIDFGDGRKIERTITGNSIHYILDKDGEVIDALAGLNSPQIFLSFLGNGEWLNRNLHAFAQDSEARKNILNSNISGQYNSLLRMTTSLGKSLNLKFDNSRRASRKFEEMPAAITAMTVAVTKSAVEMPILKDIIADISRYGEEQINLETWKKIAELSGKQAKLDENSLRFIRLQNRQLSNLEFERMIKKLEEFVSIDTARNEYLLRPTILVWLAKDEEKDLAKFNEKIYSQLFLTPSADKWLGLYAPDIYTALDGNGIK
jgi:hypothetical protein